MNIKVKSVLQNISYSFAANIVSMMISVAMILVLPKVIGIEDYGAWQLYLFYASYLGFFHFGWLDGIYLRYGGYEFSQLDKKKFSGQFFSLLILEIIIAVAAIFLIKRYAIDDVQREAVTVVFTILPLVIMYTFASFVLQITNQIKKYALLVLSERCLFFVLIVGYLLIGRSDYHGMLYLDVICKISAMLFACWCIKSLYTKPDLLSMENLNEIWENISVGSKLLLANIAGMLILGVVRFAIAQTWDVATFGKVSLSLSISNFFMVFINSLSVVFFPMLKRMDDAEQKKLYTRINTIFTLFLLMLLLTYYPIRYVLAIWLPKYSDSLTYMAILFPVCLFEAKVCLLTNTYLKSLRQEALMLKINVFTLILGTVFTCYVALYLENLLLTIVVMMLLFGLKSILAEFWVNRLLGTRGSSEMIQEVLLVVLFVLLNVNFDNNVISMLLFTSVLLVKIFLNKQILVKCFKDSYLWR